MIPWLILAVMISMIGFSCIVMFAKREDDQNRGLIGVIGCFCLIIFLFVFQIG